MLRFRFCHYARLLEWLLNLGEQVVPPEDIGFSALNSQGHEVEEATDDKHVQPGETETAEEPMVWRLKQERKCVEASFQMVFINMFSARTCFCLELDYLND